MGKVFDGVTGGAYVKSAVQLVSIYGAARFLLYIKNTHASNSIEFKVLASPGETDEQALTDEITLAAGGFWYDSIVQPWESIWFEVKNASAGNNASARAYINIKKGA